MRPLRILCWDDPRAVDPIVALGRAWAAEEPDAPGVEVRLRSLAHFNDGPIEHAIQDVDLALVDYPTIPKLAELGAIVALEAGEIVAPAVGSAQASFAWRGADWAAAVDAACQVAVARVDDPRLGAVPRTWAEVLRFADAHPGAVGLPLHPADAFCALLSIQVALRPPTATGDPEQFGLSAESIALFEALASRVDRTCFDLQPPEFLQLIADEGRWAYAPLVFGYARVSGGAAGPVAWHDAPAGDRGGAPGSVLGGAGLAVSSSGAVTRSRRFVAFASRPDAAACIIRAGGQPGHATAWREGDDFFGATRRTQAVAAVRPQHPGWTEFHAEAGAALVADLRTGRDPDALARTLRSLVRTHRIPAEEAA